MDRACGNVLPIANLSGHLEPAISISWRNRSPLIVEPSVGIRFETTNDYVSQLRNPAKKTAARTSRTPTKTSHANVDGPRHYHTSKVGLDAAHSRISKPVEVVNPPSSVRYVGQESSIVVDLVSTEELRSIRILEFGYNILEVVFRCCNSWYVSSSSQLLMWSPAPEALEACFDPASTRAFRLAWPSFSCYPTYRAGWAESSTE
jgi:hypothetical protein